MADNPESQAVLIWAGDRVDSIQFKTNHGRPSLQYGGEGGKLFAFFAPPGQALVGFEGRSGTAIDNLQVSLRSYTSSKSICGVII